MIKVINGQNPQIEIILRPLCLQKDVILIQPPNFSSDGNLCPDTHR